MVKPEHEPEGFGPRFRVSARFAMGGERCRARRLGFDKANGEEEVANQTARPPAWLAVDGEEGGKDAGVSKNPLNVNGLVPIDKLRAKLKKFKRTSKPYTKSTHPFLFRIDKFSADHQRLT
ncbi:hypothetical protein U1Q18_002905 [Sarracenia purpurea var. burkii]